MKASVLAILLALSSPLLSAESSIDAAIKTLQAVNREGEGNEAATQAWKSLAAAPVDTLPSLLAALADANPLAVNWMLAAISSLEERGAKAKTLPLDALEAFVRDTSHAPSARVVAFEMILRHAADKADSLSPTLLDDPSSELRRHPVAKLIAEADATLAKDKPAALALYRKALTAARDEDQIKPITKKLRAAGETVDLPKHFGFLMDWHLIAPFNNSERKGHDTVYPPEQEINLTASYEGKGKQAKWLPFTSEDDYGMIDFNKPFGMEKEVTGYATTDFFSATERTAEIRLGCKNAWKVWLNGELLFARDEYHRGAKLDQYKLPITLRKGKNTLLVKCSQNEQKEEWTVQWEFQLRVCDSTGTAIASAP
jgi:hypothetical protein